MDNKANQQEFKNLVKKIIAEGLKSGKLKEDYDDFDDLGIYSGDFDPHEFDNAAMQAAMADIKDSGDDFVPLGKSKFEKNLNPDEFKADLQRQNLNLPNNKKELDKIKQTLAKKKAHEKMFGAGSLNETGEWSDDEDDQAWMEALRNELDLIAGNLNMGVNMEINGVHGFDKYQGPYADIKINGDHYKVWTTENNMLWIENFPIDNTGSEGKKSGFEGYPDEVADAINTHYFDKPHFPIMDFMNENFEDFEEGPQPGDAEYHNDYEKPATGLSNFKDLDWQAIYEGLVDGIFESTNDLKEAGLSNEDIILLEYYNILSIGPGVSIWKENSSYEEFVNDVKAAYEKGFTSLNENEEGPAKDAFDTSSLYKFLADAMYTFSEGDASHMSYAEFAQFLEEEMLKHFTVTPKLSEGFVNPDSKIDRPKDAEGNPLTIRARVEFLETGAAGRVLRFGSDDNGKLTVHVEWFGEDLPIQGVPAKPAGVVYPETIVVRDNNRIVREDELEEGMGHSFTVGKGKNIKPANYPESLTREINENLDMAKPAVDEDEVFLVINNPFNRSHYKDLIGKTFPDAPPAYAQGKLVKPEEVAKEAAVYYEDNEQETPVANQMNEFDYAGEEVKFHQAQEHDKVLSLIGKKINIVNMNDIVNLIFGNQKRIQSILNGIEDEINGERVINNKIAATDNMDTEWLFEVVNVSEDTVNLEFLGTAK